jgi:hypothetical protein
MPLNLQMDQNIKNENARGLIRGHFFFNLTYFVVTIYVPCLLARNPSAHAYGLHSQFAKRQIKNLRKSNFEISKLISKLLFLRPPQ